MAAALTHICTVCQNPFGVSPSKANRGAGITCSMECRAVVRGYTPRILAVLPATAAEAAEKSHVSLACARAILGRMVHAGTAHVIGFVQNPIASGNGAPTFMPVIAEGFPVNSEMPMDTRAAVTYHTRKLIIDDMPGTIPDIAISTQMPETSVRRMTLLLWREGKCHIGAWVRSTRGKPVAIYHAGEGKDVPCKIKKLDKVTVQARYRKKLKRTADQDDAYDVRTAQQRTRYWVDKAKQGDPLVNALFGPRKTATKSGEQQP